MKKSSLLLGACAGFVAGYTFVRAREAWRELHDPSPPLKKNAADYGARKRAFMIAGFARSLASQALVAFVLSERLPQSLRRLDRPILTAAVNALSAALDTALETPIDFAERYVLERRYDLSDQSPADWLRDRIKMTAITMTLSTALVAGLLAAIRRFPRAWPLVASAAAPPLLILLSLVAPVYVAPIFNRFEPLQGPLEERLRALAARYGVGDATIMRFDMSRQTKKANAYVAGLLGTHRIALADTLLDGFTNDEIEFVVAHELGHYVARDTWLGVGVGSLAMTFLLFAGNALVLRSGTAVSTIVGFSRFSFFSQLLASLIGPGLAAGSRAIERRADRFALGATQRPDWGIAAFERLREHNLAEDEQPRWAELLIATHPSLRSRIATLRAEHRAHDDVGAGLGKLGASPSYP